ncbi:MAG: MurT ligase domain-containing protein [Clostridiaceae bacterium]
MLKIKLNSFIGIVLSKFLSRLSHFLFKGGTNFPGRIALAIDKNVLRAVAKNYKVILITGTNGKTTTTSMIYNILKDDGKSLITNGSGANLLPGIVATFISNYRFFNKNNEKYAVIEVDEANLKFITNYIKPDIIAITNLFRDQLDRYGEVYTTLNILLEGIKKTPDSTLILNGDESLLGSLDLPNPIKYYGFKTPINDEKKIDLNADAKFCKNCKSSYKYNFVTYNHLGDFYCDNCGYSRSELSYGVDQILDVTPKGSSVIINNEDFYINQPGTYNIYNALCALSIAKYYDVDSHIISSSLSKQQSSFGRQETINIEGKALKIILVKNPAGYDEALNTLTFSKDSMDIAFLLNDNYADGTDVSWIWDVNFEKINSLEVNKILVSGTRLYDMAIRLKTAGLDPSKFNICENYDNILENIVNSQEKEIYILATYTAMLSFRKFLHGKKYINELW